MTATLTLTNLQLTVTGSGWAARERLTIALASDPSGADAEVIAQVRADARGRFAFAYRLEDAPPEDEEGYVVVRGRSSRRVVIVPVQRLGNGSP